MKFCESRCWAEIDLDVLKNNLDVIKNHVGNKTKLIAVVKADAYGHGAVAISEFCEEYGVDCFAVACESEGIELRKAGIKKPILLLSYVSSQSIPDIVKYDLTTTVYDYEYADKLNEYLVSQNKSAKVHIKLDTGMSRLGFNTDDIDMAAEEIEKIYKLSNIKIEGIYTHYADSDNIDTQFCNEQFERYTKVIDRLCKMGINIPIKHTCNSAGVMAHKEKYLDAVRCGIMLYGYYPEDFLKESMPGLKPVLSWKARLSQIKVVNEDITVSYGRVGSLKKGSKTGVVSVGYADGYSRGLSDSFYVLINGKKAPVIGRVCMDQLIVDLSHIEGVKKEDVVTLIGEENNEKISADDMAKKLDTISYEVLCNVSKRVERVYIKR